MPVLQAQEVLQLLADHGVQGHADLTRWLAIARAESSLRTDVVNNSTGAVGLFQINQPVHVRAHPTWTTSWLKDPGNNVAAARVVSSGWTNTGPWVASKLGQVAATPASSLEATQFLQSPFERAAEGVVTSASAPVALAARLMDVRLWLRVGYVVAGIGLLWVAGLTVVKSAARSQVAQVVSGSAETTKRAAGRVAGTVRGS